MKLRYYPDTDSAYIEISQQPGSETCQVLDGVNIDLTADGKLIGIEIECASQRLDADAIETGLRQGRPT